MSNDPIQVEGFIVDSFHRTVKDLTQLCFSGRLADGKTFAIVETGEHAGFYLRTSDRERAEKSIHTIHPHFETCEKKTMDGEACFKVSLDTVYRLNKALEILVAHSIRTYEADIRFEDQFRISRRIHGSVRISGNLQPGRHVDCVFVNPDLAPGSWQPRLSVLSFDIETAANKNGLSEDGSIAAGSIYEGTIIAIGLSYWDPLHETTVNEVFFLGSEIGNPEIHCFDDERSLLQAFTRRVADLDPDIITGWNVIDFDFRVLATRLQKGSLPLIPGRTSEPGVFLRGTAGRGTAMHGTASRGPAPRSDTVIIRGRQIIDAARLVRAAPERYEDYSLETVAQSVLGYGKLLTLDKGNSKVKALLKLYEENPRQFCKYCLQDARLVIEILQTTGLLTLTLKRCQLTGIDLSRAWTSIAAFDFLYIEAMHNRGIVAPTLGVDSLPLSRAPGGAILEPHPGVFDYVLVFDFKSLYPSIIRTFNIDPISYVTPEERLPSFPVEEVIEAPNGAVFRRNSAILPELLDRFFENRAQSQAQNDTIASYVYKIIMNSFYGVLGANGCRFASSEVAGAITSFGQSILQWCKDLIQRKGYMVLYGDTDSLFVASEFPQDIESERAYALAKELCTYINENLFEHISGTYSVESRLVLELEKIYKRFFLPPVRVSNAQRARGRAKGYAGLKMPPSTTSAESVPVIEVIGMEAVRRDWTRLAREFQLTMLELLFDSKPITTFQAHIRDLLSAVRSGRLDEKLVYQKALRKPVSAYTRTSPPHVRAASMLDPSKQQGVVRYLWTVEGPQPEEKVSAKIDYDHYIEKQLKPICRAFTMVLDVTVEKLFSEEQQLWLF